MEPNHPKRYFLFTYPRTASNLLLKVLALDRQPSLAVRPSGGYFFMPSNILSFRTGTRFKSVDDWTDEEKSQMRQSLQDCVGDIDNHVRTANEKGKNVFIKEHCEHLLEPTARSKDWYGTVKEKRWLFNVAGSDATIQSPLNFTVLPDSFLRTFLPTFLIRHPALAYASQYRAFRDMTDQAGIDTEGDSFYASLDVHLPRTLYQWYSENLTQEESYIDADVSWPLILDADDVMEDRGVVARFADILGLTPPRYEWDTSNAVAMGHSDSPMSARMLSTITASTGIVKGLDSMNLDIDEELKKWKVEFGERPAKMLEERVRIAMPDYEFMKARKLKAKVI